MVQNLERQKCAFNVELKAEANNYLGKLEIQFTHVFLLFPAVIPLLLDVVLVS